MYYIEYTSNSGKRVPSKHKLFESAESAEQHGQMAVASGMYKRYTVVEGWSELPPINKEKYQSRDGLEGPIQTKSGKTVYYDPKAGKYYDPDTDMYMSYDEWRALDEGWCGICGQDVCVCPPGAVSESVEALKQIVADKSAAKVHGVMVDMFTASAIMQVYDAVSDKNKASMEQMLNSKAGLMKMADFAMKQINEWGGDDQYEASERAIENALSTFEEMLDSGEDELRARAEAHDYLKGELGDLGVTHGDLESKKYHGELEKEIIDIMNRRDKGMKESKSEFDGHDIMSEDPPNGIDFDYANLSKVNWEQYSEEDIKTFYSIVDNLSFESGYYNDGEFDDSHFNALKWLEKNVMNKTEAKRRPDHKMREGCSPHKKGSAKYKKHMAAKHAAMGESEELNELDLMAPKKVYVRLGDGSYKLISFRSTGSLFGSGAWDRAMGIKLSDVDDAAAQKLQLDKRLDYVLQKTDGTYYKLDSKIQTGHEDQGGLPFSTPDITVYDVNTPEWKSDVPVKVQNALNKKLTESKRWKQTSMSPEAASKEFGKENVRVKKGALRNGDDMVEVFVESVADEAAHMERDHEVQMARSDLYKIANYAVKLHKMLKNVSEEQGIQGWMQAKITKAADYMSSVAHTLEYDMMEKHQSEPMGEAKAKPDHNMKAQQKSLSKITKALAKKK